MTHLHLLSFTDRALRKPSQPVVVFDDTLSQTTKNMVEIMYALGGWGLTAPQFGLALQIVTLDVSPEQNQPHIFINPTILSKEGESKAEESSLTFPGLILTLPRASKVNIQFHDISGNIQELTAEGQLAFALQHTIDHLNGILFIDNLSKLKRDRLLKKLEKMYRDAHHHHHHDCGHDHHHHHHENGQCNHDH